MKPKFDGIRLLRIAGWKPLLAAVLVWRVANSATQAVIVCSQPVVNRAPIFGQGLQASSFELASDSRITSVRVWGGYGKNAPPAADEFTIGIFEDTGGGQPQTKPMLLFRKLSAKRTPTSLLTGPGGAVFQYDLLFPKPAVLRGGLTYYLSADSTRSGWAWSGAGGAGTGSFWHRLDDTSPWVNSAPGITQNLSFELLGEVVSETSSSNQVGEGGKSQAEPNAAGPKKPRHKPPANASHLVQEAERAFGENRFDDAEQKYQAVLQLDRTNVFTLAQLAIVQIEHKRFDDAEANLRRALTQDPDDPLSLAALGYLRARQKKLEALDPLKRAGEMDPENFEVQFLTGTGFLLIENTQAAEPALLKAARLSPNPAAAHFNLAVVYLKKTPMELEAARSHYRKALESGYPRTPVVEAKLGDSIRDPNLEKVLGARRVVASGWKPSWSPDAKRLAFARYPGEGIAVLDLESGQTTELSPKGKDPAWSPDGKYIAFVRVEPSTPQESFILAEQGWLVEAAGGQSRFLVQGGFPCWSSDSKSVYFPSRKENRILSVSISKPEAEPAVFYYQPQSGYPAISRDESRIAFGPQGKMVIANRVTGQDVRTWPMPGIAGALSAWSPDGQRVAFGYEDPFSGLWIGDADTGQLTQIAKGPYAMPDWSRDGTKLAFDYRTRAAREVWVLETKKLPQPTNGAPEMAMLQRMLTSLSAQEQERILKVARLDMPGVRTNLNSNDLKAFFELLDKATQLIKEAKYRDAIGATQRLLAIMERNYGTNTVSNAKISSMLVSLYRKTGNTSEADRTLRQIVEVALKIPESERPTAGRFLRVVALHLREGGDLPRAAHFLKEAVAIEENGSEVTPQNLVESLNSLASVYESMGQLREAESIFARAITVCENAFGKEGRQTAIVIDNLGVLFEHQGAYDKAALMHERALAMFQKALGPDHEDTGISLCNLSGLYFRLGDYAKAERLSQRALEVTQRNYGLDSEKAAVPLMNLAVLYSSQGDVSEAMPLVQLAVKLDEKFKGVDDPETALSLSNLALLYQGTGQYTEAERLFLRALEISEKRLGSEHPTLATRLGNLAGLYSNMQLADKAEAFYSRALGIAEKQLGPEHPETGMHLDNLALHYLRLGKHLETLNLARRSEQAHLKTLGTVLSFTSEQQRLAYQETQVPFTLFAALGDAGDLATAVLRRKGVVLDSLLEDRMETQASRNPEHRANAERLRTAKQQFMQIVLEAGKDVAPDERERQEKRRAALVAEIERLEGGLARAVTGLGRSRRALSVTVQQVQKTIPSHAVLLEFLRYPHWDRSAPEYRYGAILLGASGEPKWIQLGSAQAIEKNIEQYQAAVRGNTIGAGPRSKVQGPKSDESFATLLQALYQQLWSPIETALPKGTQTAIISPDGSLNFLSFATLLTPDDHFLSQKYSLRYVSSGRDLLKEKKPAANKRIAIYANPDFRSSAKAAPSGTVLAKPEEESAQLRSVDRRDLQDWRLEPLPGTAKESAALAAEAKHWDWQVEVFAGAEASEAQLASVKSPRVLHLATHGFFLPEEGAETSLGTLESRGGGVRPYAESAFMNDSNASVKPRRALKNPMHHSGLALAGAQGTLEVWKRGQTPDAVNDGILTAEEVGELKLEGTELVVLSACDTGVGQFRSVEGVLGLRRGFIQAGAENLLMTLWAVSDTETASIMTDFYEAFYAGGSAAQALSDVQRDWLVRLRQKGDIEKAVQLAGPFILNSLGAN